MSELDHALALQNSEKGEGKEVEHDVDEGYETPTSVEHKIPPVDYSRPPPAPKKRKLQVVLLLRNRREENYVRIGDDELELVFQSFAKSRVPASPNGKKRRTGDK